MFGTFFFAFAIVAIGFAQETTKSTPLAAQPTAYFIFDQDRSDAQDRTYLQQPRDRFISTWHDIPWLADQENKIYNMVVEIPRGEGDQEETNLALPMSPIMEKDTTSRESPETIDYIHNYGIIPQTFLNASEVETVSKLHGNNKPLHVVEISDAIHRVGAVVRVKIIGVLGVVEPEFTTSNGLVQPNELVEPVQPRESAIDYKFIAIDVNSPLANQVNNLEEMEKVFPDLLGSTRGFFRYFKYPAVAEIAFDGKYQDASVAEQIIDGAHQAWERLIKLPEMPKGFNTESHVEGAAHKADDAQWSKLAMN